MQNAQARVGHLGGAVVGWGESRRVRVALQVLLLLGIAAIATVAKRLEPSLGIPGSSAPLWLGALVAGRAIVRRDGAGTLMGLSVAVMGIPVGINNTFMHNLGLYGLTGLALDLVAQLPRMKIRNPIGAIICGASAHMVKFGFIFAAAYTASITKHFLLVGVAQSAALHLGFGAVAGVAGWGVYKMTRLARKPTRT